MKKLLLALAMVSVLAISCKKENPTISFFTNISVLMADSPLKVDVAVSEAVEGTLSVPVTVAGSAVKGSDYTLSSESFVFSSGSKTASIEIIPKNNFEEGKEIALSIVPPAGYDAGSILNMIVTVESKEKISYSFTAEKADLLNAYNMTLELKGMKSGSNFTASSDMEIPVLFDETSTAKLGEDFTVEGDATAFKVAAGTNKATLVINAADKNVELGSEKTLVVRVDESRLDSRFYAGNTPSINISVKGIMRYSQLVGTWEFVEIAELEEWQIWVEDMGDDSSLMPVNNAGYQLSFALEDGVLKLIPGNVKGDMGNYFRECEVNYCEPKNMAIGGVRLGDYCSEEAFLWTSEVVQYTYFGLSKANRAFSADTEEIGAGVIAMRFTDDGNLWIVTKDYDQPPFMESWWGDGFDPDMFGFCYVMKRVQ